jgi:EAL domain-containing protein (putative c-di-GMP-specific phosphodiesterase class I)
MGKATIAECVENAESKKLLQEIGVDYIQGFHIEKPAAIK